MTNLKLNISPTDHVIQWDRGVSLYEKKVVPSMDQIFSWIEFHLSIYGSLVYARKAQNQFTQHYEFSLDL